MKGKKIIIGILCGIGVIAVGLGVWKFKTIEHSLRRLVSSPEEYFRYIEEEASENAFTALAASYDTAKANLNAETPESYDGAVTISFGDAFHALFNEDDSDSSDISNFGMKFSGTADAVSKETEVAMSYFLNDTVVLNGNIWLNQANGNCFLQIPELSKDTLYFSFEELADIDVETTEEVYDKINQVYEKLPEPQQLKTILSRYTGIILNGVDEVEEMKDIVAVDQVSVECVKLTAVLDEEKQAAICEAIVEEMLVDEEIKAIVTGFASVDEEADPEEVYKEFRSELKHVLKEAKDVSNYEDELEYSVWVDKKGNIVSRQLKYGTDIELFYAMPVDKTDFGLEVYALIEDESVSLSGTGALSLKEATGVFRLALDEDEVLEAAVEAQGIVSGKEGVKECRITLTPLGGFKDWLIEMDEELEDYRNVSIGLRDLNFVISSKKQDQRSTTKFAMEIAKEPFFAVAYELEELQGKTVTVPDKSKAREIKNEAEFLEWLSEAKMNDLIDKLKDAGSPKEWFENVEFDQELVKYEAGMAYIEQEDYQRAKDILFALGDYRDAEEYVYFCEGMLLYEKGELEEAVALFDNIEDNHWGMIQGMNECRYRLAENYLAEENYEAAAEHFYKVFLNHYYYSELCDDAYDMYCYAAAMQHALEGDYEAARDALLEVQGDYEPVQKLMEECQAQLAEQDALLQRPLHVLGPVNYAAYAEYAVLPERYTGIPMSKPTEEEYGAYIAWEAQDALNKGNELSQDEIPRLREKCEEEKYTFAVMDYLLVHADVTQMDEAEIEMKAKCDMYRFRLDLEASGIGWEEFLRSMFYTEEDMLAEHVTERRNREKVMILAYAIAKKEGLTVSEEDFDYYVSDMAEDLGVTEEDFLQANPKEVLDEVFLVEKGMNFLIENAEFQ